MSTPSTPPGGKPAGPRSHGPDGMELTTSSPSRTLCATAKVRSGPVSTPGGSAPSADDSFTSVTLACLVLALERGALASLAVQS